MNKPTYLAPREPTPGVRRSGRTSRMLDGVLAALQQGVQPVYIVVHDYAIRSYMMNLLTAKPGFPATAPKQVRFIKAADVQRTGALDGISMDQIFWDHAARGEA